MFDHRLHLQRALQLVVIDKISLGFTPFQMVAGRAETLFDLWVYLDMYSGIIQSRVVSPFESPAFNTEAFLRHCAIGENTDFEPLVRGIPEYLWTDCGTDNCHASLAHFCRQLEIQHNLDTGIRLRLRDRGYIESRVVSAFRAFSTLATLLLADDLHKLSTEAVNAQYTRLVNQWNREHGRARQFAESIARSPLRPPPQWLIDEARIANETRTKLSESRNGKEESSKEEGGEEEGRETCGET